MNWMTYHISEEFFIAFLCCAIAFRAFRSSKSGVLTSEVQSRLLLIGAGFFLLSLSSTSHAVIHAFRMNQNLLYQTLLGYCLGLLTLIVAVSSEKPRNKYFLPFLYLPLLVLFHPNIYTVFPIFGDFRPLVWIFVAYLSGVVCVLYLGTFYRTRAKNYLYSSLGHALICTSAVVLFFPAPIGSLPWIYGHLLRPLGFTILFFSMKGEDLSKLTGSIIYKALAAYSMLTSIPLLVYGTVVMYENINPIDFMGRRMIVFVILLVTLASVLLFGLGLIINLLRPILRLKDAVSMLVEKNLRETIDIASNDEIGELTGAYNEMVVKLRDSITERERLSRLAATGELSATLAHEIRNPLHAISMAASYIKSLYKGRLIREFVTIIQNEASRVNALTSSLLNFAKPLHPEIKKTDMNSLVQEIGALLREEAKEQNVAIELMVDDNLPLVEFDHNQIKQVLLNLVINSLDAIQKEGLIRIQTKLSNGNVLLSVEDNGAGIKPEDLKNIFNPFFSTKTRGTGLGLAVSKKIAKEHGGDLLIESVPSLGSKFTLTLPVDI
jgi:signal transduction histidine kinase